MFERRTQGSDELARIHRDLARRHKEPLRILIATDPKKPVRAIVLPRTLPMIVLVSVIAICVVAGVLSMTSWKLGTAVRRLQGRVSSMVAAAEDVARHPLPSTTSVTRMDGVFSIEPAPVRPPSGDKARFVVESVNNGEQVEVVLDIASGEVEAGSYRKLRHLMRCLRTGAETPIDPRLAELLFRIAQRTRQKIVLVSGFRAPMFSKADLSYHTRGMAADIRIPGMTPLMVRDLVQSMGVNGVGYYPTSQFVHVDVRDERFYWTDHGSDRGDSEGSEHGRSTAAAQEP